MIDGQSLCVSRSSSRKLVVKTTAFEGNGIDIAAAGGLLLLIA